MHPVLHAFFSQTAPEGQAQNPIMGFLPFILIAVVFYFVFFRPQAKQAKQHKQFLSELKKGDEVLTQGGIIGTIIFVEDRTVTIDAGGGTKLRVLKSQVAGQWKQVESAPVKAEAKK
ncbi:preprotein translocase subunit YajC [Anaeromyxobacter terrae]|uniref:preprotein translocase subunit YajC n=1 Tax=Anaeromyxobacter terrae TaxID=2925406 RepID=UPI001F56613C|nr:preprotein translocase subunit YajC [Anaeromyxobacter sp. SG22]